ncbi:MAG TPA: aminoacyl-tRNA hydrolase [Chitinophagales bacterium]|nr:aminoacyl-tRNA hydrolase [Chitinophagales bacterium]
MSKFLIVGLGNIGNEYTDTRHNIGFNIVDTLADQLKVNFTVDKLAMYANGTYKGKQIHIIKPTTYMNLSGKAIKYWAEFLKIDLENVLVILDDLALPFGTLRLKSKGSDAGHNGLRSIQTELQTQNYPRLRFGIGDNFQKGKQVNFVLGKWSVEEQKKLEDRILLACEMTLSFCFAGINNTMNSYNNK